MVVMYIAEKDALEITFSEHDDVIQTFPADRADDAFRIILLPRGPRRGGDFLDAERFGLPQKSISIDRIAIPDQVVRCLSCAAGLNELTRCPNGGGMGVTLK